jgi:hypothetical protein
MTSAVIVRPASAVTILSADPRTVTHTRPRPSATSADDVMTESKATIDFSSNLSTGNANHGLPFHVHVLFASIKLVKRRICGYGARPFHMGSTIPVS